MKRARRRPGSSRTPPATRWIRTQLATRIQPLARPQPSDLWRPPDPSLRLLRNSSIVAVLSRRNVTFVRVADDETPDEMGDECDESALHFAAQDGDIARVRPLLADGRSPNAFDVTSKTPLHYAAEREHIDIMRVLLDGGADVNAHEEARIGNTPLRGVAGECSLAVATFRVDHGADPWIPGWMQLTALHKAKERKDQEGRRVYALLKSVAERGDL